MREFPRFCGLLQVVDIDSGRRMPMRLTPIQRAYCATRTPKDIILKPRKVFMTTLEVARDLWWFLTRRGARVVVVCQSEQGSAARRTVQGMLRVLLESLRRALPGVGSAAHRGERFDVETDTELAWHARDATLRIMEAGAAERTAHKGGRSQTVNRLHATETAFWEHGHATLNSLVNAMPPGRESGEVVIESTANGAAGYYFEQWQEATRGTNGFAPHFFPWHRQSTYRTPLAPGEVVRPRDEREARLFASGISPEQVKWYREKSATIGVKLASQEFPDDPTSCFLVSGHGFFDGVAVERMLRDARPPVVSEVGEQSGSSGVLVNALVVPALRVWHAPEPDREYVVGSDTSDGTGGSAGCGVVLERGTGKHVATLWGQFRPWVLAKHLAALGRHYNDAVLAVERNNTGLTVLRALDVEQHYPDDLVFHDRDDKPGWNTSPASRAPMLDTLEEAVRRRAFVTDDVHLLGEMRTFVVTVTGSRERPEHARGARDDLVIGASIAWEVACRRKRAPVAEDWVP
jgi:hypothetical protein